eukprot:CFRG6837T1
MEEPIPDDLLAVVNLRIALWEEFDDMDAAEKAWLDDSCLRRYLRARDYIHKNALKMLRNTIKWRRAYKPEAITEDQIADMSWTGSMYVNGFDKYNHPVIYIRTAFGPPSTAEDKIKFIVYILEQTIKAMPSGLSNVYVRLRTCVHACTTERAKTDPEQVEKWMIVFDLKGFSLSRHGDPGVARKFVELLQDHYPERLHQIVTINSPSIFVAFYKALYACVDKVTRKKVQLKGKMDSEEAFTYLSQFINKDQLEDYYSGDLPTKVPPNIVEKLEPLWRQHKDQKKAPKKPEKPKKKSNVGIEVNEVRRSNNSLDGNTNE